VQYLNIPARYSNLKLTFEYSHWEDRFTDDARLGGRAGYTDCSRLKIVRKLVERLIFTHRGTRLMHALPTPNIPYYMTAPPRL